MFTWNGGNLRILLAREGVPIIEPISMILCKNLRMRTESRARSNFNIFVLSWNFTIIFALIGRPLP